jgi:hypothetical protein
MALNIISGKKVRVDFPFGESGNNPGQGINFKAVAIMVLTAFKRSNN